MLNLDIQRTIRVKAILYIQMTSANNFQVHKGNETNVFKPDLKDDKEVDLPSLMTVF